MTWQTGGAVAIVNAVAELEGAVDELESCVEPSSSVRLCASAVKRWKGCVALGAVAALASVLDEVEAGVES